MRQMKNLCVPVAARVVLGFGLTPVFAPTTASALDYIWTGAAPSNDWADTTGFPSFDTNWQTGAITTQFPGVGDTVEFNSSLTGAINVNLDGIRITVSATFTGSNPITINQSELLVTGNSITALGPSSNYTINSNLTFFPTSMWNISGGSTQLRVNGLVESDGLTKSGTGTLVLAGPNTISLPVTVNAGTLQIGAGGTIGSLPVDVINNGTTAFNRSDNVTYSNLISGSGSLRKDGGGTLTLTADNTLTGTTTINAGALHLGNGGTTGSVNGDIVNNASLTFNRSNTQTFSNAISGSGSVRKIGSGLLILSGANSYAGATRIQQGELRITDDTNLGNGGDTILYPDTTLRVTGTSTSTRAFQMLGAAATIEVDSGQSYTINGDISSSGVDFHKTGDGTLTLNGSNTNPSGTVVEAGVLVLANSLSAGAGPIDIQGGELRVDNDVTLGVIGIASPGNITISGGAVFTTSVGSETTLGQFASIALNGGTINSDRVKLQFGAEIDGSGAVNARILAGTGSTLATAGDLTLGHASATNGFYTNGDVLVTGGTTLTLADANDAVLDSGAFVSIGNTFDGTLAAVNGLTLDFGGNIVGRGTIDTPDDPAKPFTNNGSINGESLANPLTLTGYVKGVGTLNNVVITGTDAPGFSPAAVNRGSVSYAGTLEIEIGGPSPGSAGGHDQINHVLGDGEAQLGGHLDLSLINGFAPSPYDAFTILTSATLNNTTFDTITGQYYTSGRILAVTYTATDVVIIDALRGDLDLDGDVDGVDISSMFVNFNGPGGGVPANPLADLDGDGDVDGVDISTAFVAFTGPLAPANVPEPATALLLALGMVSAAHRRRR